MLLRFHIFNINVCTPRLQDKLDTLSAALETHRCELEELDVDSTPMDVYKDKFNTSEQLALEFKKYQHMCNDRLRKPAVKKDKK